MPKDVTVILPTLNEGKAIRQVIEEIKHLPIKAEIMVVDGLSKDKTVDIAKELGVRVIYETRKGKGIAVRKALKRVVTPYIVMIDADGTYPTEVIVEFCEQLSKYDVVKGDRSWHDKGAMSKTHRFGNWALSLLASILYRKRVRDVCSGLWAMKRERVRKFNLVSDGFTLEADLFINTVRAKCSFKELPIVYSKRIQGEKAKLMLSDGFKIGWFLVKKRFIK